MPTQEYGWVWVPGRTWYPNTVNWRTSPESEEPDSSYIGWAPIPPPNYTPPPGYYPEGYSGSGPYRGSLENLITAPFWIFVRAANFLMGFSNPYTPSYSYWGCNCLIPPPAVPHYYRRTVIVNNYYTPGYYPAGFITTGTGYYNWGPPIPYVARVTRINQTVINNYVRQSNIYQYRNVTPPPEVLARRSYFRNVLPPAMVARQPLPQGMPYRDKHIARASLVRPNLINASVVKDVPTVSTPIPKAQMTGKEHGHWQRGVPGAALPSSAVMPPNQQMGEQIRRIPGHQRLEPVSPSARKWQAPQTPGAEVVQPAPMHRRPRGPEMTTTPGAQTAMPPQTAPYRMRPAPPGTPETGSPWQPAPSQDAAGRAKKPSPLEGLTSGTPGSPPQVGAPPQRFKPRERGSWGKYEQTPQTVVTPSPSPSQRQTPAYVPGSPPAATSSAPQVWPQRRPHAYQPQPQQQPQVMQPPPSQSQPTVMQPPQPRTPRQMQPQAQPTPQPQMQRRMPPPPQAQMQRQVQPPPQVMQQPRPSSPPQAQSRPQPQQQQQQQQQQGRKGQRQQNQ
jgi:hypothetical protein